MGHRIWVLTGTMVVVLSGCAGNAPGQGEGGSSGACAANEVMDGLGYCRVVCSADALCPTDYTCQQAIGLCVPEEDGSVGGGGSGGGGGSCHPESCPVGWLCPEGAAGDDCVPGPGYCEAEADCSFSERCDEGRCVPRAGEVVLTCGTDGDCGPLMTCQLGVCVGCLDDLQCVVQSGGSKCVGGVCVTADLGSATECLNADCAEGTRCNPTTGLCEPTCEANEDCEEGEICAPVLARCVTDPGCSADEDCPGAQTCTTGLGFDAGVCVGCSEEAPCAEGLRCTVGACLPDIGGGAAACAEVICGGDELCDPLDGTCYSSDGTCEEAADCRDGQSCNFIGLCAGCSVDGDCRPQQSCILGACAPL